MVSLVGSIPLICLYNFNFGFFISESVSVYSSISSIFYYTIIMVVIELSCWAFIVLCWCWLKVFNNVKLFLIDKSRHLTVLINCDWNRSIGCMYKLFLNYSDYSWKPDCYLPFVILMIFISKVVWVLLSVQEVSNSNPVVQYNPFDERNLRIVPNIPKMY